MSDPLRKVRPNEPFEARASTWNAFIDAADAHRRSRAPGAGGGPLPDFLPPAVHVRLQNPGSSITTLDEFSVQSYGPALTDPATSEAVRMAARSAPVFVGQTPGSASDQVAVTTEPIAGQQIGRAVCAGVAVVRLSVTGDGLARAVPVAGESGYMQTAAAGGYPVLAIGGEVEDSDPPLSWGLVLLGPVGEGAAATAADCVDALIMADDTSCFHATTKAGTGPCSTFDAAQELDFAWDTDAYYSATALTTPDGTVQNLKLWFDTTGEPTPALAYDDDSYRFKYAGCCDGAMVFKGRREKCDDGGDTGETTTTCGDKPFEVHIRCVACDVVLCGGVELAHFLCTTLTADDPAQAEVAEFMSLWGDKVSLANSGPGGALVPDAWASAPRFRADHPTLTNTSYRWMWGFDCAAIPGDPYPGEPIKNFRLTLYQLEVYHFLDPVDPAITRTRTTNLGPVAVTDFSLTTGDVSPWDWAGTLKNPGLSGTGTATATVEEDTYPPACAEAVTPPDACEDGTDPLTVVIATGANAGTYTTSSLSAGVRTVTIGGTGYTVAKSPTLGWVAYPTVATTPKVAATAVSCPPLTLTFAGEVFGSDDPVVVTPPAGGTGCTLLATDQDAAVQVGGVDVGSTTWTAATQETGSVALGGGPQIRFVAVGGVVYAQWYGASSTPGTDPPDYSVAADATPTCNTTCYAATFTDARLALLVGGTVVLRVGDCATPCTTCDIACTNGDVAPGTSYTGLSVTGDLYGEAVWNFSTLVNGGSQIVFYFGSDTVVFDYQVDLGIFRLFGTGGSGMTTGGSSWTTGVDVTVRLSKVGTAYTATATGGASVSLGQTFAYTGITDLQVGGFESGDVGTIMDPCFQSQ